MQILQLGLFLKKSYKLSIEIVLGTLIFQNYCYLWTETVNVNKTRILLTDTKGTAIKDLFLKVKNWK